jgi:DNA invertase Pin-like site-specific DNA recombinase
VRGERSSTELAKLGGRDGTKRRSGFSISSRVTIPKFQHRENGTDDHKNGGERTVKNAIELIRVSTKAQAGEDRAGIPAQHEANVRTAKLHGLTISERIQLVDVSGAAILRTPEMQSLMAKVESRKYHGIIVKEFSRALRPENYGDYILFQLMADSKTTLYTASGPIEPWTTQGRMMVAFNGVMAANEIETIRSRMQGGKEAKRREGKHPGNDENLPFGVGYSKARGWFWEPGAEKIREAFRLTIAGEPLIQIARKVGLSRHGVSYALKNPIYTGWRVIDQKTDPNVRTYTEDGRQKNKPRIARAPDEIIRVKVLEDPIVTEAEFGRVQEILERRRVTYFRGSSKSNKDLFVYRGFLSCGLCGDPIHVQHAKSGYYVCGTRIRAIRAKCYGDVLAAKMPDHVCETEWMQRLRLEEKLDQLFGDRLTDSGFLEEVVQEIEHRAKARGSKSRFARLRAEIRELESKRDRATELYVDAKISREKHDAMVEKIDRELQASRDLS